MTRAVVVVLATVVVVAPALAEQTEAYITLRKAPRFAVGPVGRAGTISAEESALHDLLSQPTASTDLRRLLSEATLPGQLYALWGLAVSGEADFQKLSERVAVIVTPVDTMDGCLVQPEAASSIVENIRRGKYGQPASRTVNPANPQLQRSAPGCGPNDENRPAANEHDGGR